MVLFLLFFCRYVGEQLPPPSPGASLTVTDVCFAFLVSDVKKRNIFIQEDRGFGHHKVVFWNLGSVT